MAYSAYDDKRIDLNRAFQTAFEMTQGDESVAPEEFLPTIRRRTIGFYQLLTELAGDLVGERPAPAPKSGGWKGGGSNSGPSVRSTLEKVSMDYFGDGKPIEFYDQRPAKKASKYSATAPDFQSVAEFDLRGTGEAKNIPIWLKNKDGNVNVQAVELLNKHGIPLEPATPGAVEDIPVPASLPEPF